MTMSVIQYYSPSSLSQFGGCRSSVTDSFPAPPSTRSSRHIAESALSALDELGRPGDMEASEYEGAKQAFNQSYTSIFSGPVPKCLSEASDVAPCPNIMSKFSKALSPLKPLGVLHPKEGSSISPDSEWGKFQSQVNSYIEERFSRPSGVDPQESQATSRQLVLYVDPSKHASQLALGSRNDSFNNPARSHARTQQSYDCSCRKSCKGHSMRTYNGPESKFTALSFSPSLSSLYDPVWHIFNQTIQNLGDKQGWGANSDSLSLSGYTFFMPSRYHSSFLPVSTGLRPFNTLVHLPHPPHPSRHHHITSMQTSRHTSFSCPPPEKSTNYSVTFHTPTTRLASMYPGLSMAPPYQSSLHPSMPTKKQSVIPAGSCWVHTCCSPGTRVSTANLTTTQYPPSPTGELSRAPITQSKGSATQETDAQGSKQYPMAGAWDDSWDQEIE